MNEQPAPAPQTAPASPAAAPHAGRAEAPPTHQLQRLGHARDVQPITAVLLKRVEGDLGAPTPAPVPVAA